jgi:hypothetical protein
MLLSRILRGVNKNGLLREKQFVFRPRYSTALQLARLVERGNRIFGKYRLIGVLLLDAVKPFYTL